MNATGRGVGRPESDEQRFERLYEQHFNRVASYLLARTSRDSAAEAVARTFEITWRRLPGRGRADHRRAGRADRRRGARR